MAHHEQLLTGDADELIAHLEGRILGGSITGKLESASDQSIGDARMLLRVYERYSSIGGNRLSLSVSVLAVGPDLAVSVVAAGGSGALFIKINTFGEEAFLDLAVQALDSFTRKRPGLSYMDEDGR